MLLKELFVAEGHAPFVGQIYNVDWDGPSIVKVVNVTTRGGRPEISVDRIDKNGKALSGPENKSDLSVAEWNKMEPKLVGSKDSTKPTTDPIDELKKLARQLVSILKGMPEGRQVTSRDIQDPEVRGKSIDVAIRYWGNWSNPSDAANEEDYDWQVLSKESQKKLDAKVKEFEKDNAIKIQWSTEEKNYINFTLSPK